MVFKRVGGMLIGSTNFDMQLITRLLVEVGYSKSHVTNWFGEGEDDAQNVPAMTKLLKAVASLGKKAASDFSEERCRSLNFETLLSDTRILAMICEKAFNVITMQDPHADAQHFLSLDQLNEAASCLAHLYFCLFREHAGAFVPPQHYYNMQISLRGYYVSQAVSKSLKIENYFFYQDADDREEMMFGQQRTLSHGSNFDVVQFEERAGELMSLEEIYGRNPEMRKASRRLSGVLFDHLNPKTIIGRSKDYAPVRLAGVSLPARWQSGSQQAASALSSILDASKCDWRAIAAERYEGVGPDMLRPRGVYVGVTVKDELAAPPPAPPPALAQTDEEEVDSWMCFEDDVQEVAEEEEEPEGRAADSTQLCQACRLPTDGQTVDRRRRVMLNHYQGFECISAEKALRIHFSSDKKKAVERMRRVRSAARAGTREPAAEGPVEDIEGEVVANIDTVRVLIKAPMGVTYVVASVISFDVQRGGLLAKNVDSVLVSELAQPSTTVRCQVLRPRALHTEVDDSAELVFSARPAASAETLTVHGCFVRPVNPTMIDATESGGSREWRLPIFSLNVLMELHYLEIKLELKKLPALKQAEAVVRDGAGRAVFVVDGTEADTPSGQAQPSKRATADVKCELCGQSWKADRMRQHVGAHILCEPSWEHHGVVKPEYPCGLCGVRASIGQVMLEPNTVLGCPCGVVGTAAHPKPSHQCKLVGDVSYTLGAAAKSSTKTPCTNRPIKCTVCSAAVWSYSMAAHFEKKHIGMTMCARRTFKPAHACAHAKAAGW